MSDMKIRYFNRKEEVLQDKAICVENRELFGKFLEFEEHKLKRTNGLRELDNSTFSTLYCYLTKLQIVNSWFQNKPWKDLTKDDIQNVYDGLEDGKILRANGKPFDKRSLCCSYYNKVLKSKPFEMAGKLQLAQEVIQYPTKGSQEVKFITEEDFFKLVENAYKPKHKLLFWLSWDIGENINSLLYLKKSDFYRQINPQTNEPEFRINLRREILKRSRTDRSEITNYHQTSQLIESVLSGLNDEDRIFPFGYGTALKIFSRAIRRTPVRCIPTGELPTWKDLRSGMACDLLKKGWTTNEVNARLGHKPSSSEIDKYVSFLAIDRHKPKVKVQQYELEKMQQEIESFKQREKLWDLRRHEARVEIEEIKKLLTLSIQNQQNVEMNFQKVFPGLKK